METKLRDLPDGSFFKVPGRRKRFRKVNSWATRTIALSPEEQAIKRRSHDIVSAAYVRDSSKRCLVFDLDRVVIPE